MAWRPRYPRCASGEARLFKTAALACSRSSRPSTDLVVRRLLEVGRRSMIGHAIDEFVDWYCSEPRLAFNRIVRLRYRSHLESRQLAPGTINLRFGAVCRLACEVAYAGLLSADLARNYLACRQIGTKCTVPQQSTVSRGQSSFVGTDISCI